jgi:hypothetical protein
VSESQLEESKSQPALKQSSSDNSSLFGKSKGLYFENALVENSSVVSNEIDMKSPQLLEEEEDRPSSGAKQNTTSPLSDKQTSGIRTIGLQQRIEDLVLKVNSAFK